MIKNHIWNGFNSMRFFSDWWHKLVVRIVYIHLPSTLRLPQLILSLDDVCHLLTNNGPSLITTFLLFFESINMPVSLFQHIIVNLFQIVTIELVDSALCLQCFFLLMLLYKMCWLYNVVFVLIGKNMNFIFCESWLFHLIESFGVRWV